MRPRGGHPGARPLGDPTGRPDPATPTHTEVELPPGFEDRVLHDRATRIRDPRVRSFVLARIAAFLEQAGR